jgi:hypothetical protein
MKDKNLKTILYTLRVAETIYLMSFFLILYLHTIPRELVTLPLEFWLVGSFMLLPVLVFKNIFVALYRNSALTSSDKMWLLIRSILYILLAVFAYPLIYIS